VSDAPQEFVVEIDESGSRLDRFLVSRMPAQSRSALTRMIADGHVDVNGVQASKAGQLLELSSRITLRLPPPPTQTLEPQSVPFEIIHEDDDLMIIDKPARVVVHPGHGCREGTIVNGLLGRGIKLSPRGAPDRPGIVHRLDKGTSGLLIIAKSDEAHGVLTDAFAARTVKKRYVALVWGHPKPDEDVIEKAIGRNRNNPTKMTVGGRACREAITRYETQESMPGFSLLTLYPETGRTHQIRVHLQSLNHPIVGDDKYGGQMWKGVQNNTKRRVLADFDRIALHAAGLRFTHPISGKEIQFKAPLPDDFTSLLDVLRRD
jgi:23S rRNA pseudouridine1911/1915/1917 synthase